MQQQEPSLSQSEASCGTARGQLIGHRTADELRQSVEKYIGNSWIASNEEHKTVYSLWSAFRDECIAGRGGMTINERLYCFDLLDAWDSAKTEEDRTVVRHKIDFVAGIVKCLSAPSTPSAAQSRVRSNHSFKRTGLRPAA